MTETLKLDYTNKTEIILMPTNIIQLDIGANFLIQDLYIHDYFHKN